MTLLTTRPAITEPNPYLLAQGSLLLSLDLRITHLATTDAPHSYSHYTISPSVDTDTDPDPFSSNKELNQQKQDRNNYFEYENWNPGMQQISKN